MEKKLAGEIAVITGSDSGIGQATAIAVAREGADIAITYLEDRQGAEHTQKVVEEAGQTAIVVQLDQSKREAIEQLFKQVHDKLGTPTILVNNAVGKTANKPVKDISYIAPGMVLTPINQSAMDDPNVWQQVQSIPMKRAGEPQEVAHAAVFLAFSDGRYIHSTTLFIDGGLTQNIGQGA